MATRKGTNQFMRQGQTAENLYGAESMAKSPVPAVNNPPRDEKP